MSDRVKIQDALARLVAKREEQERRLMQPRTILADNDDEETRKDVRAASDVGRDAGQTSFSMASLMNNLPRQGHETNLSDVSLLDKIHSSLIPRKVAKLPPPPLQAAPPPPRIREELKLDEKIAETLYPHQKIGVEWLFSLHKQQKGGILGDDMGLGKTMQVSAFLSAMIKSKSSRALIVAPKTLLAHWEKELDHCGLRRVTYPYYEGGEGTRQSALRSIALGGGVLLTTYGMVLHNSSKLDLEWDSIVLDEGHKVKNPATKLSKALHLLLGNVKIIVSGTPIQNNLLEMHALFDWCCPGLLGDRKTFQKTYEKIITVGQDRNASERDRVKGAAVAEEMRRIIAPFFLRREKSEVLRPQGVEMDAEGDPTAVGASSQRISQKNDLVVWLCLTPLQRRIYQAFIKSPAVNAALNNTGSVLASLSVLKKVCDHPGLLSPTAASNVIKGSQKVHQVMGIGRSKGNESDDESDSIYSSSEEEEEEEEEEASAHRHQRRGAQPEEEDDGWMTLAQDSIESQLLREIENKGAEASSKSSFILALLSELSSKGHRTLIFSQSRVMLDILAAGIKAMGLSMCRIDGSMEIKERQAEVKRFQREGSEVPVFLLTSQVGGLGLTLTAADRVVICDPAWNPSVDSQAVDRAYRIGQKRNVVVYRLLCCGTVEEKIYRKQIAKLSLAKTGTEEGVQMRYFSHSDLRDLFSISEEGLAKSKTQVQLSKLHSSQRKLPPGLKEHIDWLELHSAGVSDHDLLFSTVEVGPNIRPGEGRRILDAMREEDEGARCSSHPTDPAFIADLGSKLKGVSLDEAEDEKSSAEREARKRIEALQLAIKRQIDLLRNIGPSMLDGGAKIKTKLIELEQDVAIEQAKIVSLEQPSLPPYDAPASGFSPMAQPSDSFVSANSQCDEVVLVDDTASSNRRRTFIDLTQD